MSTPTYADTGEIRFTYFQNKTRPGGDTMAMAWPAFCKWVQDQPEVPKAAAPLVKLATFDGPRSNSTLQAITGIEGDYDAGTLHPVSALDRLERAGVRAMIVTTHSHTEQAPRWRVFAPLSRPHAPGAREGLVAALNGVLGGQLADESFTLSQSYFIGRPPGGDFKALVTFDDPTDGTPLDLLPELMDTAIGKRKADPDTPQTKPDTDRDKRDTPRTKPDEGVLLDLAAALAYIDPSDYQTWVDVGMALKTIDALDLWLEWSARDARFDVQEASDKWASFDPRNTTHKHVFKLAQAAGWQNPGPSKSRPKFEFVPIGDLLAKPEPVRWLIADLMEAGTLGCLFGASKGGKSFMALDWAACVATGKPWLGRDVEQGPVFYIAGEGHAGIKRRLRAWELEHDIPLAGAPLHVSTCPAALIDATSAEAVGEAIAAMVDAVGTPKLIIIDTLARNMGGGDESSNADMGRFINNVDVMLRTRFDTAVLFVHHTGWTQSDRSRGASALPAALDHEFRIEHKDDDTRELTFTKMKESEIPPPLAFTLKQVPLAGWHDEDGELMTSAVLVEVAPSERKPKRPKVTQREGLALEDLRAACSAIPLDTPVPTPTNTAGTTMDAWRETVYARTLAGMVGDSRRKAFTRLAEGMLSKGLIGVQGYIVWPLA